MAGSLRAAAVRLVRHKLRPLHVALGLFCMFLVFSLTSQQGPRDSSATQIRPVTSRFPSYGAASKTVAINFYGLTRSLTHTHASIVKNLFEPLKQAGYEVDVFLHTYDLTHLTNTRVGEDAELNTTEWKLLAPYDVSITSQAAFLEEYSDEIQICREKGRPLEPNGWQTDKDPDGQNLVNLMCQLNSLNEVSHLWRRHHATRRYAAVIYARPDVLYNCPYDTRLVDNIEPSTVYLPMFHPSGGINDRFTMSVPHVAEHIGDRMFFTLGTCGAKPVHAEQFMHRFLTFNHLFSRYVVGFPFYRIRANGFIHKNDLSFMPKACDEAAVREFVHPTQVTLLDRW